MTNEMTSATLLRMIGFMVICVGVAWALQITAFGGGAALSRLTWVLGAASLAGAGVGLIFASSTLPNPAQAEV